MARRRARVGRATVGGPVVSSGRARRIRGPRRDGRRRCTGHDRILSRGPDAPSGRAGRAGRIPVDARREDRARADQPHHRRLRRQPPARARGRGRGRARAAELVIFPELALSRLSAQGPARAPGLRRRGARLARRAGGGAGRLADGGAGRLPRAAARRRGRGRALVQQRRAHRRRAGHPRRAQVAAADLRRVRRVALLRAGGRGRADPVPGPPPRGLDLRGHLERRRLLAAPALPRRSHRGAGGAPAPRSSSTSRPRPSRSRSATCARACWRPRRGAGGGRWCSSTRSAGRTIWCSTAPAWRSTPPAR